MSKSRFSLDEYTKEDVALHGNQMYGGKRHDEICDYLQSSYGFSEEQINDISMGVWLAIEAEKQVHQQELTQLRDVAKDFIFILNNFHKCEDKDYFEMMYQSIINIKVKHKDLIGKINKENER